MTKPNAAIIMPAPWRVGRRFWLWTGFEYSAVDKRVGFAAPTDSRRHFWSSGYAWGACRLNPNGSGCTVEFEVLCGEIQFDEFNLSGLGALQFENTQVLKKGNTLRCTVSA